MRSDDSCKRLQFNSKQRFCQRPTFNFLFSFMADQVQPVDMVKVRIQLQGEGGAASVRSGPFATAGGIIKNEGFFSLYKG